MSITEYQIRLLAPFLTNTQMFELFGITAEDIDKVFVNNDKRPKPNIHSLPIILERLVRGAEEVRKISVCMDGLNAYKWPVTCLAMCVDDLDITVRACRHLYNADMVYVWQICVKNRSELSSGDVNNGERFDRKTLNEIGQMLKALGLDFGIPSTDPAIREAMRRTGR